jgi:hypothetical protein
MSISPSAPEFRPLDRSLLDEVRTELALREIGGCRVRSWNYGLFANCSAVCDS